MLKLIMMQIDNNVVSLALRKKSFVIHLRAQLYLYIYIYNLFITKFKVFYPFIRHLFYMLPNQQ